MAGNKMNPKTKTKDDKNKHNKSACQGRSNDEGAEQDLALLRKPIRTSITGFAQARKVFDFATEELKSLLTSECDVLYECKVCRNIFRSLANFVSHKRVYCKDRFNTSLHGHFIKASSTISELSKIKHLEEEYQDFLKNKNNTEKETPDERVPLSKDLTAVVEKITKIRGVTKSDVNVSSSEESISLQKIPSSEVAVFQNVTTEEAPVVDDMRTQVTELDRILSNDQAVLQEDGKCVTEDVTMKDDNNTTSNSNDTESVIQISDDDDETDVGGLKCKICNLQFATQKTLKFHIKYKHLENRLVYPCPDCLEIFSTSWSVYRHLFKVHRKTAAQIRRLRESIQNKAFRMNNPPAYYEKKKNNMKLLAQQKLTDEERIDQENQAWMDNMETDGELPRCGGCGRSFERRAALAAHIQACQPRTRALARRPLENKKIEIQIRKDYNKGPSAMSNIPLSTSKTLITPDVQDDKPPLKCSSSKIETVKFSVDKNIKTSEEAHLCNDETEEKTDSPIVSQSMNDDTDPVQQEQNEETQKNEDLESNNEKLKLPFSDYIEKQNMDAFKKKIELDVNLTKFYCKKCECKYSSLKTFYEHMASHYSWNRYACKLCNYRSFDIDKLPLHIKSIHQLEGDDEFYLSTVKVLDANEAIDFGLMNDKTVTESNEVSNETNYESPDSRRPSRCSSDSSRYSDNESVSSSSQVVVDSKNRKRTSNLVRSNPKRRKEGSKSKSSSPLKDDNRDQSQSTATMNKVMQVIFGDEIDSANKSKIIEENSSDVDECYEKLLAKKVSGSSKQALSTTRRPVRKRTRPKNEDFEYDLSNLLKLEAEAYRDAQTSSNSRSTQLKRKAPTDAPQVPEAASPKDCRGALLVISKKAAANGCASIRLSDSLLTSIQQVQRPILPFLRPQLPIILKNLSSVKQSAVVTNTTDKVLSTTNLSSTEGSCKVDSTDSASTVAPLVVKPSDEMVNENGSHLQKSQSSDVCNSTVTKNADDSLHTKPNVEIPKILPIKFRRQSLDLRKNTELSKKINDLTKAGVKTKILLIKPINRNKDGVPSGNGPFKFPTIKMKDGNKEITDKKDTAESSVMKPLIECPQTDKVEECSAIKSAKSTADTSLLSDSADTSLVDRSNDISIKSEDISADNILPKDV